ncbi:MAG: hypothetical protein V4675_12085 [Verrucomicrobiota bacterium]
MKPRIFSLWWLCLVQLLGGHAGWAQKPPVPDALQPWAGWALRGVKDLISPPLYSDAAQRLKLWPSVLSLETGPEGGTFKGNVRVYDQSWLTLPGGAETWPQEVMINGQPVPVLTRDQLPAVLLAVGEYELSGRFRWQGLPEKLPVPPGFGMLSLTVDGKLVESPDQEADGTVWLKRTRSESAERDFLSLQVYRLIEDGIPVVLHTEIELSVAGKSREEELGQALPEGWLLSAVESPIPCAVEENGRIKAQVRAGKWQIRLTAFRNDPPTEFRYAAGVKPLTETELIGLKAAPELRVIELRGITSVDVSQTTFPEAWRQLPVHLWETQTPFGIEEKMRGMGAERPPGLNFTREFWLDESGAMATYRDILTGTSQRTWRLDAAPGNELGAVKISGQGQLITRNPLTQAHGVEVRTRQLRLEATGRAPFGSAIPATGWMSDADGLTATLHLPPGWRLLAVSGPEWSSGDWLTAWSLLDVFLLLIFSMAVMRLWGWLPGVVALAGLILSWQEPGAPRWTWFALIGLLALWRVVPRGGWAARSVLAGIGVAVLAFASVAVPFLSQQLTGMMFPQVETVGRRGGPVIMAGSVKEAQIEGRIVDDSYFSNSRSAGLELESDGKKPSVKSNMIYDKKAQIQTGPALPEWEWRRVQFGWNGPVAAGQTIRPILISSGVQRVLVGVRLGLLGLLAWFLWRRRDGGSDKPQASPGAAPSPVAVVMLAGWLLGALTQPSHAQTAAPAVAPPSAVIPDPAMLETLREELLKPPEAFPGAAEIPLVKLTLTDRVLTMEATIHTAAFCAVPLPGRLPAWSPVSVMLGGQPAPAVARRENYLWIALPPGTHQVSVRGAIPSSSEWLWAFLLPPRVVEIEAPGWTVTGVKPGGIPEAQVFFARQQAAPGAAAAYDRRDFNARVMVERHLELGLIWQVRTTVRRLSAPGKALAFSLPLLPGERILTGEVVPAEGRVQVRLGAQDQEFRWESELPVQPVLTLAAEKTDRWTERWHLEASPVWNVALSGLAPVFTPGGSDLIPSWQPWPGETVTLTVNRPEPISGETATVRRVGHVVSLGAQRRSTTLTLDVEASVGRDFPVTLPPGAEIKVLEHLGKSAPVRREGDRVIIPVRPGDQTIELQWQEMAGLPFTASAGSVSLPVESSNITTTLKLPENRWLLWARGPRQGPAIRFWAVLAAALLVALVLGRIPLSPLKPAQWLLLLPGLTQIHVAAGSFFVVWLFWMAWRGKHGPALPRALFNLNQLALLAGAGVAGLTLMAVLHTGLLGHPTMFILGEGSWRNSLQWFEGRSPILLPAPEVISVSIWVYRGLMLAWSLWLAVTLLHYIRRAWQDYSNGGLWKAAPPSANPATPHDIITQHPKPTLNPPPLPPAPVD